MFVKLTMKTGMMMENVKKFVTLTNLETKLEYAVIIALKILPGIKKTLNVNVMKIMRRYIINVN